MLMTYGPRHARRARGLITAPAAADMTRCITKLATTMASSNVSHEIDTTAIKQAACAALISTLEVSDASLGLPH